MNKMQRCWLLTELFYPEETSTSYLLTKIANKLTEKYEINVICGPEVYDEEKKVQLADTNSDLHPLIKIKRIRASGISKNNGALLLGLRSLWISFRIAFYLLCHVKKEDKVLMVTTPVFLLLFVSCFKFFKSFSLKILVYDVFPENAIAAGLGGFLMKLFYPAIRRIFEWAYASADTLIVLGRDMKEKMAQKISCFKSSACIEIIENWAEVELIQCRERKVAGVDGQKINIQYAGNLGRVQGLMELLKMIKNSDNSFLSFAFIGSGALKERMGAYVLANHLDTRICFEGSYKRSDQEKILNKCDIAIITLAQGMYGLAVPSKTYNVMAAGRPILYIGPAGSEIWQMVVENNIGFCFEPGNEQGIIDFLNQLRPEHLDVFQQMGRKARILAEKRYSEQFILQKYLSIL